MIPIEPIPVWERGHTRRIVADVEAAARFLVYEWPEEFADHPLRKIAQEEALHLMERGGAPLAFPNLFASAAAAAGVLAPAEPKAEPKLAGHIARPWDMPLAKKRRR